MPHVKRDFEKRRKKIVEAVRFHGTATVFVRIRRLDLRIRRGPHPVRPRSFFCIFTLLTRFCVNVTIKSRIFLP
jgi:hypothetical protein